MKKLLLGCFLILSTTMAVAEDFSLPGLDGKTHRLSDYKGKWVVVNYWATWCPPCLAEIPELVEFHAKHKDKTAVVLGVNREDVSQEYLSNFVDEYFINYPILRSSAGSRESVGPIPGLPTTYLVSPEGEVVARQVGAITGKMIEDFINKQNK